MSYAIHMDPHYNAGSRSRPQRLVDDEEVIIALETEADAQKIVDMMSSSVPGAAPFLLAHDQIDRPTYKVAPSEARTRSLAAVMAALKLDYDFNTDGTRKAEPDPWG